MHNVGEKKEKVDVKSVEKTPHSSNRDNGTRVLYSYSCNIRIIYVRRVCELK